jgi:hypothetical protein
MSHFQHFVLHRYRRKRPTVIMSESAFKNVPQELIMAVAGNIRDDKKSLEAFSLVCKAWTNPARDHLFASWTIRVGRGERSIVERIKAANITSKYTPFLRHLRLSAFNMESLWHELVPFLVDFRTPRLQSLSLLPLAWHALSPNERSALIGRFELIVSLQLSLCGRDPPNDIAAIICSFPRLRKLTLMPTWREWESSGPSESPLSPELRLPEGLSTLYISYSCQDYQWFLEWLSSIPERHSIRTFHITMRCLQPQDLDTINMFLRALGPSLEMFGCQSDGMFIPSASTVEIF